MDAGNGAAGGLLRGGFGSERQQLDHQSAQQAADDPALLLTASVQDRVERLSGDEGFEDDLHAQHVAVERQRAVHVGHPDDEMTERHVREDGHEVTQRLGAGRPANSGRSR